MNKNQTLSVENKSLLKKTFTELVIVIVGSIIYSVGFSYFIVPNNFAPGGVSGISVIVGRLVPLPVGIIMLLLNIPLIIIGLFVLGKKYMLLTAFASVCISISTDLLSKFEPLREYLHVSDPLLCAIVSGLFAGCGIGIIFRGGGSSGGTDIVVRMLRIKYKHLKSGILFIMIDTLVILASAIVFSDIEGSLYSAIVLVVTSKVLDLVLYGKDEAKLLIIVSDRHELVAQRLLVEVETGATFLDGSGAYTGSAKRVLICAIKKPYFTKVRNAVKEVDENAFMIVTSASEIFGKGYKKHNVDEL